MTSRSAAAALAADGFVVIPGFLSAAEVAAGRADFLRHFPAPESFFESPDDPRWAWLRSGEFAGLVDFPFAGTALNDHATADRLTDLAAAIVETEDVRLIQARAWGKYAGNDDYDQELHRDFPSHTLAHPSDAPGLREVIGFLYYSDVDEASGATRVLPAADAAGIADHVVNLPRGDHPDRHQREVAAVGPAGSLVLYSPMSFHRGAALGPPPSYRWLVGVAFRAAGADWMGHQAWPASGVRPEMTRFITRATPRQRSLLGFPPPGHRYWTRQTLDGVAARYPGIDMTPYER